MGVYEDLGLHPVINAATTFTALGGSLMPPEVIAAMNDAAGSFVEMNELHLAAGAKIARLTRNEAAYVTPGCAAALVLALLGLRTRGNPGRLRSFPGRDDAPYEVVMHAAHRIPYDATIALAGVEIRQFGNIIQTFDWELDAAITDKTVALLYVAGSHLPQSALPLERVVEIAHARDVPVIVDAAAQLPPAENFWRFTRDLGADLVTFSGGKALRGPQASGILAGNAELVEFARQNGAPLQRWGRAVKVGKEEIAGLLAAVERFVELDHDAQSAEWLGVVERWGQELGGIDGVRIALDPRNEAGQPVPRLHVGIEDPVFAAVALEAIAAHNPRVAVLPHFSNGVPRGFWIGADLLQPGEAEIVGSIVIHVLHEARKRAN